jgi:hypothetical protein
MLSYAQRSKFRATKNLRDKGNTTNPAFREAGSSDWRVNRILVFLPNGEAESSSSEGDSIVLKIFRRPDAAGAFREENVFICGYKQRSQEEVIEASFLGSLVFRDVYDRISEVKTR